MEPDGPSNATSAFASSTAGPNQSNSLFARPAMPECVQPAARTVKLVRKRETAFSQPHEACDANRDFLVTWLQYIAIALPIILTNTSGRALY